MIERMVNWLINRQILLGNLKKEEISVYRYGYTLMLERILNYLILLSIVILTKQWTTVFIFLLSFIPIRSYAGGWHANKFVVCVLVSNFSIIMSIIISQISTIVMPIYYTLVAIYTMLILWKYAPVENEKKRLEKAEKKKYRKCALCILLLEIIAQIVMYSMNVVYINIICFSQIVIDVSLIIEMMRKKVTLSER